MATLFAGIAAVSAVSPEPLAAQGGQQQQQLRQQVGDEEIIRRLRQSGLTPEQIRQQLQARGYSPGEVEPWLQVLEGRTSELPQGVSRVPIMSLLGGAETGVAGLGEIPGQQAGQLMFPQDTLPPVFGRQLFQAATSQFQPSLTGPVPDDYQLGPGDRIQLVLTGAVQQAYELTVSPEGWIVIPEVGRVPVAGRTIEELRDTLYNRLSQVYSGITREPGGKTQFEVSVSQIRTIQVYVVGEVTRPSAYRVSGMGTVLTALYQAGGPNRNGSFRYVVVNRGGEAVAEIDLYDYLLRGRAEEDVRLRNGDIVFVPIAERQVRVSGPVKRPGIYEVRPEEGLRDVIRYAGGVQSTAELRRVQIERVLPPEQRAPGQDRAILDLPVGDLRAPAEEVERIPVLDGDLINVFAVVDSAHNRVRISGAVWRPGTYGANDSTRLWDLIEKAGGLQPDVYEGRAQIQRLQRDYTRRMIHATLARTESGEPVDNPKIEGRDQVYVFNERNLREDRRVSIGGWVQQPGVYPYSEGMTVEDLILQAGGIRTGGHLETAEVSRVNFSRAPSDTLSRTYRVTLDSSYLADRDGTGRAEEGAPAGDLPSAVSFELRNLDAVHVRKSPGFEEPESVVVTGEVRYPGEYSIHSEDERLTDVIRRAGGVTEHAYRGGVQLWRPADLRLPPEERDTAALDRGMQQPPGAAGTLADTAVAAAARPPAGAVRGIPVTDERGRYVVRDTTGRYYIVRDTTVQDTLGTFGEGGFEVREVGVFKTGRLPRDTIRQRRARVGTDFVRALDRPQSVFNLPVQHGDSIHVPEYHPTVTVRGAVGVESQVLYREGAGVDYYIDQAGGYAANADEGRTRVRYANGEVEVKGGGFLFFGGGVSDPDPSSEVVVPVAPPRERGEGVSLGQIAGLVSTVTSSVATIIALTR